MTRDVSVERWAQQLIRGAVDQHGARLPRYGSAEWAALPSTHRWASILIAAECWRQESDPAEIANRLGLELATERHLGPKLDEDTGYRTKAAEHRTAWGYLARPRGGRPPGEFRQDVGPVGDLIEHAERQLVHAAESGDDLGADLWSWVVEQLQTTASAAA